jgi:hypothetical protein
VFSVLYVGTVGSLIEICVCFTATTFFNELMNGLSKSVGLVLVSCYHRFF